jgi:hypothetical protein
MDYNTAKQIMIDVWGSGERLYWEGYDCYPVLEGFIECDSERIFTHTFNNIKHIAESLGLLEKECEIEHERIESDYYRIMFTLDLRYISEKQFESLARLHCLTCG